MLAALLLCPVALGQQKASASSSAHPTTKSVTPKLTPEQERGLRLLKAAQAEAGGLQPEMRAFVLLRASSGYAKVNPAKAHALLRQAFEATLNIENPEGDPERCRNFAEPCHTKLWLQMMIFAQIQKASPEEVFKLLPKAQDDVRRDMTQSMIHYYAEHDNSEAAKELLDRFAGEKGYPYVAAAELMMLLPEERSPERLAIFSQAMSNYQQFPDPMPQLEDFATMVVRFWRDLPPAMVMDAIDAILEHAKDTEDDTNRMKMTVYAQKGEISLANVYQLRLFELLPVIEELDKSKAEILLRQNADAAAMFGRYPMGLQSLSKYRSRGTTVSDFLQDGIHAVSYSMDPAQAAMSHEQMKQQGELNRRSDEIVDEARTNPKQALAEAMALPLKGPFSYSSPRLGCLSAIAARTARSEPSVAESVLEEQSKALDSAPLDSQGPVALDIIRTYVVLSREDRARQAVKQGLKIAQKLYERDTDADDPNLAFKGFWPSTTMWSAILRQANVIAPSLAEEITHEIPDPEIAALERVFYADSCLGVMSTDMQVIRAYKKETRVSARRE